MAIRTAVFRANQDPERDKASTFLKRALAQHQVEIGVAKRIHKHAIQLLPFAANVADKFKRSEQGDAYSRAAAEPHRSYVVGGLTRTEYKPVPFNLMRGARVGH